MIIHTRIFDLLTWLVPKTEAFPKAYRFTVTQRLMGSALDVHDALAEALGSRGQSRRRYLQSADRSLIRLRLYLRLAHHWRWLSHGQYEHASRLVAEVGRLLGGWLKRESGQRMGGAGP